MNENILVSVVMTVYNSEKYLEQAVESILKQSLRAIELICVIDNGSADNSENLLKSIAGQDSRVKIIYNRLPSDGAGAARNLGVRNASGEYLAIVDADDFFEPDMLETGYKKAVETNADVVMFDAYMYDNCLKKDETVSWILNEQFLPVNNCFSSEENADNLFQMTLGAAWNGLYRRQMIMDNNLQFASIYHADDVGFVYSSLACAKTITYIKRRLLHYRRNNVSSQSANMLRWPLSCCEAFASLRGELERLGLLKKYKRTFVKRAVAYVFSYMDALNEKESFEQLYKAFREQYIYSLGVADNLEDFEGLVRFKLGLIMNNGPEEYLLNLYQGLENKVRIKRYSWLIPGEKIAIYGAGKQGKRLFLELMEDGKCKVCAWVDKNHRQIGYPVQAPLKLTEVDFDYVVIAIENKKVATTVKDYLMSLSVSEEKIKWLFE